MTNATGSTSCPDSPTTSSLVQSYVYDAHENRVTSTTHAGGAVTHTLVTDRNQLENESATGVDVDYAYDETLGEIVATTGTYDPGARFLGQWVLPNSDAFVWVSGTATVKRTQLVLNHHRVYDPRLGQYTSPEPMVTDTAGALPAFQYAAASPYQYVDMTGECPALALPEHRPCKAICAEGHALCPECIIGCAECR